MTDRLHGQRVAVTGAGGQLGGYLVPALRSAGATVIALGHSVGPGVDLAVEVVVDRPGAAGGEVAAQAGPEHRRQRQARRARDDHRSHRRPEQQRDDPRLGQRDVVARVREQLDPGGS